MIIFEGRAEAQKKEEKIKDRVEKLQEKGIIPKMVSILGDDSPENELYVSMKGKFAKRVGIEFFVHHFEVTDKVDKIIEDIRQVNKDNSIQGLMVQLPISEPFEILDVIDPRKDIDCLTSENLGRLMKGNSRFLPATVRAVLDILKAAEMQRCKDAKTTRKLQGSNVCIVGASDIIGKPLAMCLSDLGATVTICRSTTKNLHAFTKEADILISATGAPQLITQDMIKDGAVVIDVGISRLLREGRYKVVGDIDAGAVNKASFITPVPGGVGPVTVACLFENLLDACNSIV